MSPEELIRQEGLRLILAGAKKLGWCVFIEENADLTTIQGLVVGTKEWAAQDDETP